MLPRWGGELLFPWPDLPWLQGPGRPLCDLLGGGAFRVALAGGVPAVREAGPGIWVDGDSPAGVPWTIGELWRAPVDRASGSSTRAARFPAVRFGPGSGWFVLVRADASSFEAVLGALRLLGLTGIGRGRSCGLGGFAVEGFEVWAEPEGQRPAGRVLLSPEPVSSCQPGRVLLQRRRGAALPEGTFVEGPPAGEDRSFGVLAFRAEG